jgi:hypothetical protein
LLTGGDDAAFCKRVSEALNNGWELSGSPVISFDPVKGKVICGQAIIKDAGGVWTDEMKESSFRLSEQ